MRIEAPVDMPRSEAVLLTCLKIHPEVDVLVDGAILFFYCVTASYRPGAEILRNPDGGRAHWLERQTAPQAPSIPSHLFTPMLSCQRHLLSSLALRVLAESVPSCQPHKEEHVDFGRVAE